MKKFFRRLRALRNAWKYLPEEDTIAQRLRIPFGHIRETVTRIEIRPPRGNPIHCWGVWYFDLEGKMVLLQSCGGFNECLKALKETII